MGLASKLAAAGGAYVATQVIQGAQPGPGNPPPPNYQGSTYQPQQQQQPPVPITGSGPTGSSQSYQSPPATRDDYRNILYNAVRRNDLERIIPQSRIEAIASSAGPDINSLCQRWGLPEFIGRSLIQLALYDIILYIDDSGSMRFEENGERIDDLKLILQRVASAVTLFDHDGVGIRFMNTNLRDGQGDHVRNEHEVDELMRAVSFSGLTPMGRELRRKVLDKMVLTKARRGNIEKPFLVIIVTDGQPAGDDSPKAIFHAVRDSVAEMQRLTRSRKALSFQFAQVGNDIKAREFLGSLDSDPEAGAHVDCTSNYEQEQDELRRLDAAAAAQFTPQMWLVKLLLGAIDPEFDSKDEQRSWRPGPAARPNYAQYPQSQPPPQPQYQQWNAPHPDTQGHQQYGGASQGYPNYGQPAYGQPPQAPGGFPSQQNYAQGSAQSYYQQSGPGGPFQGNPQYPNPSGYGGPPGSYQPPPPPRY